MVGIKVLVNIYLLFVDLAPSSRYHSVNRSKFPCFSYMARLKVARSIYDNLQHVNPRLSPSTASWSFRTLLHAKSTIEPAVVASKPAYLSRYTSSSSRASMQLRQTPLYNLHIKYSAKIMPFAGYSMPVQYSDLSLVESHNWTRQKASLFDVSHMSVGSLLSPVSSTVSR